MKTALVFGASGGIGSATVTQLQNQQYTLIGLNRSQLDFCQAQADQVSSIIRQTDPDVIINCAGVMKGEFTEIFDVNVASNWYIINHFIQSATDVKPVTIVLVGSTAHQSGRRNYPVYAASKAALHNLVQGCQEALSDTPIVLSLLHPARVKTQMSNHLAQHQNMLTTQQVAAEIVKMCSEPSQIKELNYQS